MPGSFSRQLGATQGHPVAPVRCQRRAVGEEPVGVRAGHRARLVGARGDRRQQRRRQALEAPLAVRVEACQQCRQLLGAGPAQRRGMAADGRHLRHHAFHPPIQCGHFQHMSAAVAGSPDADAAGVDPGLGAQPGDRVAIATALHHRIDFLTRFAVAVAEVRMIVEEHDEAGGGEYLGVTVQVLLLHPGKTVRHDDRRPLGTRLRQIQPAAQGDTLGAEFHVQSLHACLPGQSSRNGPSIGILPRRRRPPTDEGYAESDKAK